MGRRLKHYGVTVPFIASIATTGNTDEYVQVPKSGYLESAIIGSLSGLAASDTNYVTVTVTNLGQAGAGTTEMLATSDANTTKSTGGTAWTASAGRSLTIHGTKANLKVVEGDTLRIRASATGTLSGAVTKPRVTLLIAANGA